MTNLSLCLLLIAFKCTAPTKYKFPDPTLNYEECGNDHKSFICDPQKYLTNSKKVEIDALLLSMKNDEYIKCDYIQKSRKIGVQIGIVIIDTFSSYPIIDGITLNNKNKYELREIYAKKIHKQWGVGKKYCNNGILIFLSVKDKVIHISTGSGVKHIINSYWIKNTLIANIMKPLLKRKQYSAAVYTCVNQIKKRIIGSKTSFNSNSNSIVSKETVTYIFSWILGFVLICCFGCFFKILESNNAKKIDCCCKLSAINESFKNRTFDKNICPICLINFDKINKLNIIRIRPGCGHKFCKECLIKRLNIDKIPNKLKCLICQNEDDNNLGNYYETLFYKELKFRVLSVSKIYPQFIKHKYIEKWLHHDFTGNIRLPQKKQKTKNVSTNDEDTYDNIINDYYSSDISVKSSRSIKSTGSRSPPSFSFSAGSISCGSGGGGGWSS